MDSSIETRQFEWTYVEFDDSTRQAKHLLRLTKWRILFYRSEKRISLDPDGFKLTLEGEEYFWPIISWPQAFKDLEGRMDSSATSAEYQWPLFGLPFKCETQLEKDQGVIRLDAGWLQSRLLLATHSKAELKLR